MFFEPSATPSLTLDIPGGEPASSSSSSPPSPSPSPSPAPMVAGPSSGSGSGSATTDTTGSSASLHTSLSQSLSSSSSSSSLPPVPPTAGPILNVKFAPLPLLAPRKRRSTAPLGMAARGQLVRGQQQQQRRRVTVALADSGESSQNSAVPAEVVLTPAELEELRYKQEEMAARYAHFQASAHALAAREMEAEVVVEEEAKEARMKERARERGEREREKARERYGPRNGDKAAGGEEGEDPLLALGKAVKGVGRFWRRRVASKVDADVVDDTKHKSNDGERAGALRRRKSDVGRQSESSVASSSSTPRSSSPPLPLRPILANIPTNITPTDAPQRALPQVPLGDDAATIVPRRRAKAKAEDGEEEGGEDQDGGNGNDRTRTQLRDKEDGHGENEAKEQREAQHEAIEEGGVWEEEIGDGIPLNAGQTQTIVGGRVVASVTSIATTTISSSASSSTSTSTPTSTTTTTTIEVTATATATSATTKSSKTHGKTAGPGKPEGARLVKAPLRSSFARRGKAHAQVGDART